MTTLKNWKNINCMHMHADNIFMCGKYNSWINLNDVVGGKKYIEITDPEYSNFARIVSVALSLMHGFHTHSQNAQRHGSEGAFIVLTRNVAVLQPSCSVAWNTNLHEECSCETASAN